MMPLTFGSLFAGIGGFDLGFERAGMQCRWQVEIDDYANRILKKHWPEVRRWQDVRTFPPEPIAEWCVDVICGGFPCQDLSYAGKRAGIEGARSGLFFDAVRVVAAIRPRVVVLENVAGLLSSGMGRVLGELAAIGYDAEWRCISAASVGAPHIRERVFIIAYTESIRWTDLDEKKQIEYTSRNCNTFAEIQRRLIAADIYVEPDFANPRSGIRRIDDGLPEALDRWRGLGNAVVPQVAEVIGRQIVKALA